MSQLLTNDDISGLMREKFAGPAGAQRLSQLLAAIFGTERPDGIEVDGPVTIRQPAPDVPALTIVPFPGATVPPSNAGGGGGGGGLPPDAIVFPDPPATGSLPTAIPVVMYGVVASGSGHSYQVDCYMTNPSLNAPIGRFPCYQAQIDASETIPPGTHCLVWCAVAANNTLTGFRMTVPVFL